MQKVKIQEAVGMVLGHDITKIVPNEFKGRAFKKGHIIKIEDIPEFLNLGKEHIYVFDNTLEKIHENEAALRLAKAGGRQGIKFSEPNEGKVNLISQYDGVLKVNKDVLNKINCLDEIMFASLHTNRPVKKGQVVAGTRIIPLVVAEEKIRQAEDICNGESLVEIKPYNSYKVGVVTTGSEVYHGRIKDAFLPVLEKKLKPYGSEIIGQIIVPDDKKMIKVAINKLITKGAEIILTTGGMSVDPDDVTPSAIRELGTTIVTYGAPVLPGAMFLLGYLGEAPIMGLPGCVMYARTTIFDLVLPRVLTGEKVTKKDIVQLGHGGLCLECSTCTYPNCSFGKGE